MERDIYIGWDSREPLCYDVAKYSIERRSSWPLSIMPLKLTTLKPILDRPIEWRGNQMWCPISNAPQTTEFSITRFLVPFLNFSGWALFCDPDIVCLADIEKLFELADPDYAVMVVKHDYTPTDDFHMVDQIQVKIPRKNWASVILWNCEHEANKRLTLDVVRTWPGRDLHGFKWLKDSEIGSLPLEWNYLVDVYTNTVEPKLLHFTNGGPWLDGWEPLESDQTWNEEYQSFLKQKV